MEESFQEEFDFMVHNFLIEEKGSVVGSTEEYECKVYKNQLIAAESFYIKNKTDQILEATLDIS